MLGKFRNKKDITRESYEHEKVLNPYWKDEPRSKKGNFTTTNPSKTYVFDEYGVLHPPNVEFTMPILEAGTDYFLVTYVIGEGTTGERTEQRIMTREEANNLNFLGYRILSVIRIY